MGSTANDAWTFLRAFLKDPPVVASAVPSSRTLERRIVHAAAIDSAKLVIELGGGTGGTTRALLEAMPDDGKLLVFESTDTFAEGLRQIADERLEVIHGCASTISTVLAERGLTGVDAVVSGIPFSTLPPETATAIVEQISTSLGHNGRFVAYQFTAAVRDYGRPILGEPRVEHEFQNIPPVRLFTWRQAGSNAAA